MGKGNKLGKECKEGKREEESMKRRKVERCRAANLKFYASESPLLLISTAFLTWK